MAHSHHGTQYSHENECSITTHNDLDKSSKKEDTCNMILFIENSKQNQMVFLRLQTQKIQLKGKETDAIKSGGEGHVSDPRGGVQWPYLISWQEW